MTATFKAIVATTDPIPARNLRFSEQALYDIAKHIRSSGGMRMGIEHNPENQIHPHILQVEVCATERDTLALMVTFELSDEEAGMCKGKEGFSISVSEFFQYSSAVGTSDMPFLFLLADSCHFDDDTLEAAIRDLAPYFSVEARYLHQFSVLPPPQVIVDIAVNAAGNVLSAAVISAIVTACSRFLKSKDNQPTVFTFKRGDTTVYLRTTDAQLLRETVEKSFQMPSAPVKATRTAKKTSSAPNP